MILPASSNRKERGNKHDPLPVSCLSEARKALLELCLARPSLLHPLNYHQVLMILPLLMYFSSIHFSPSLFLPLW